MKNDIYQDGIKQLARTMIASKKLDQPDTSVRLDNRLCGDRVDIELCCNDGVVTQLHHKVRGCLLCEAATNIVAQHGVGATIAELENITEQLINFLNNNDNSSLPFISSWQKLNLFSPVSQHKSRHQCVLLPFQAVQQALAKICQ